MDAHFADSMYDNTCLIKIRLDIWGRGSCGSIRAPIWGACYHPR